MAVYRTGDLVQMRKTHPCGSDVWQLLYVGADIKLKCRGCGRIVMMERFLFEKRVKKLLQTSVGQESPEV